MGHAGGGESLVVSEKPAGQDNALLAAGFVILRVVVSRVVKSGSAAVRVGAWRVKFGGLCWGEAGWFVVRGGGTGFCGTERAVTERGGFLLFWGWTDVTA